MPVCVFVGTGIIWGVYFYKRARARVCVCVCACARAWDQQITETNYVPFLLQEQCYSQFKTPLERLQ